MEKFRFSAPLPRPHRARKTARRGLVPKDPFFEVQRPFEHLNRTFPSKSNLVCTGRAYFDAVGARRAAPCCATPRSAPQRKILTTPLIFDFSVNLVLKTSNGQKIARIASISTKFNQKSSQRRALSFRKIFHATWAQKSFSFRFSFLGKFSLEIEYAIRR